MRVISTGIFLLLNILFLRSYARTFQPHQEQTINSGSDSSAYQSSQAINNISNKTVRSIGNGYDHLSGIITRRTEKMLERMEKKELSLQAKMQGIDSAKAKALFSQTKFKYQQLIDQLHAPADQHSAFPLKEYIPGVDSIQTAFGFLQKAGASMPGVPEDKLQAIETTNTQIRQFQGNFQQATDMQQYIKQREQFLKDQLSGYGLGKELSGINQEAFYAQQQIVEYKAMLTDRKKLETKLLASLNDIPAFSQFMQKNSHLGQLFGLPDNYSSVQSLTGLQTRSQVQQLIGQFAGAPTGNNSASADPTQYLQQQMQQAQQQLSQLKDKLNVLGNSGGSGDITMPQGQPNDERVKTWLNRLEYGFNLQTQQSTSFLPSLANLSLTIGYKLSQRISLGIGASYRIGLGMGLNHMALSNQGIGIRTYTNMYLKGSIGISGGIEYNYMQAFVKWPSINRPDIWQRSALIGLIKKTKVSGHKEATIQLLYDALYRQHIPASAPLIFRLGYTFK